MKRILVLGILFLGLFPLWGQSGANREVAQVEWRENCLASRSFADKVKAEITVKSAAEKEIEEIQKNAETILMKCASEKGITSLQTEFELQKSIMACPNEYEAWARSSPAKILLHAELRELSSQLSRINRFLLHSCLAMN